MFAIKLNLFIKIIETLDFMVLGYLLLLASDLSYRNRSNPFVPEIQKIYNHEKK